MSAARALVVLLGESAFMAAGLRQVLDATNEYQVAGAFTSDEAALGAVERSPVSFVIMDLRASAEARIAVLRKIKVARPVVRVVIITGLLDADNTAALMLAGADGLLDPGISPDALVAVLDLLQDKVRFVTSHSLWPAILQALTTHQDRENRERDMDREHALTRRENDVFALLRDGLTDREIAQVLTLSLWTVKHHVVNILQKLNMTSRREASRDRAALRPRKPTPPVS